MSPVDPSTLLADRVSLVDASGIRKVFDLAATMTDPINLSIGQPDFDVPPPIKQAAVQAIESGCNRYTQTQGNAELVEDIRTMLKQTRDYEPEEVFVASGVSGGLLLAMLALVQPGDDVLIPDPYFVMYKHLVRLCGGNPVYIDTYPDFHLTAERVEAALTERTKLLFVNSPCNPTGVIMTDDELAGVARVCRQHGVLVVSDEIYDRFCYDRPFESMMSHCPDGLLMGGFSKSYAMTGWRLAYVAGPAALCQQMIKLQQYTFVCAPSFAQQAGRTALSVDISDHIDDYRRKRDLVIDGLSDRFAVTGGDGAFYLFIEAPGTSGTEFVMKAIENNVLIIPGNVFSQRDTHFRLCYTTDDDTLRRGIDVLNNVADTLG